MALPVDPAFHPNLTDCGQTLCVTSCDVSVQQFRRTVRDLRPKKRFHHRALRDVAQEHTSNTIIIDNGRRMLLGRRCVSTARVNASECLGSWFHALRRFCAFGPFAELECLDYLLRQPLYMLGPVPNILAVKIGPSPQAMSFLFYKNLVNRKLLMSGLLAHMTS